MSSIYCIFDDVLKNIIKNSLIIKQLSNYKSMNNLILLNENPPLSLNYLNMPINLLSYAKLAVSLQEGYR